MRECSRVKLSTSECFEVATEEKRRFYVTMALLQFHYECAPEYNEIHLLRRLSNEFQKHNQAIIKASELDPNNLALNGMKNYFARHYGNLRKLLDNMLLTPNL